MQPTLAETFFYLVFPIAGLIACTGCVVWIAMQKTSKSLAGVFYLSPATTQKRR